MLTYVTPSGIINTLAGNYSISFSGDGGPATAAALNAVSDVAIDANGSIYIADCHNNRIRKVATSLSSCMYATDSFGININNLCTGPQLSISAHTYNSGYSVKCSYGDGTSATSAFSQGSLNTGYAFLTHAYQLPGTYTMKAVLLNGGIAFDSLIYSYNYKLCNTLNVQYYFDINGNCVYDAGENTITRPILTEVDSNSIPIDTLSSTGGIYYTAYGNPGDIYTFRTLSVPSGWATACPSSGIVKDTIQSTAYNNHLKTVGITCTSSTGFDLNVSALVPVSGVHDQWGNIYVGNAYCAPENATVTLHYSKHYQVDMGNGQLDVRPTPASYTDSTVTWNVAGLSGSDAHPVDLYYAIWVNPDSGLVPGFPAHSYYTIDPTTGDANASNNIVIRVDTVKGGCDPNEMEVLPQGNIAPGTSLQYTLNFTNTGNDTTYNVYVLDTLSENVDVSSFHLLMSSAVMNINKIKYGNRTIMKFDFPNINLLDSLHHPQDCSRGLVYTINAKQGLPYGTTIFNNAGVYFDYNPVVLTNKVENIIDTTNSLTVPHMDMSSIGLYPNPATNILLVNNASANSIGYSINDIVGRQVTDGTLYPGENKLDITGLSSGIYIFKTNTGNIVRFVKR